MVENRYHVLRLSRRSREVNELRRIAVNTKLMENSLFNDPKYSDLTIVCQDRKFHTHRVILCTQTQFFKAACNESSRVLNSINVWKD